MTLDERMGNARRALNALHNKMEADGWGHGHPVLQYLRAADRRLLNGARRGHRGRANRVDALNKLSDALTAADGVSALTYLEIQGVMAHLIA